MTSKNRFMQVVEYIVVRIFASRAEPYQMKYKSRTSYLFGGKGGVGFLYCHRKITFSDALECIHEYINTYLDKCIFCLYLYSTVKVQNIGQKRYKAKTKFKYQLCENCILNFCPSKSGTQNHRSIGPCFNQALLERNFYTLKEQD